jgi:hypothetical protein
MLCWLEVRILARVVVDSEDRVGGSVVKKLFYEGVGSILDE